jgi:hypothetical protein
VAIDLLKLLSPFENVEDFENAVAFFRTRVPWVGSAAYLHIVFRPADSDVLLTSSKKLRMPRPVIDFLARQNGAHLFSGALSIYGSVRHGQLLNRSEPDLLPPLNIEDMNMARPDLDYDRYLVLGSYGFDGSLTCVDRTDGSVALFAPKSQSLLTSWRSFELWIHSEVARLSALFDRFGHRLVGSSATVPGREGTIQ